MTSSEFLGARELAHAEGAAQWNADRNAMKHAEAAEGTLATDVMVQARLPGGS